MNYDSDARTPSHWHSHSQTRGGVVLTNFFFSFSRPLRTTMTAATPPLSTRTTSSITVTTTSASRYRYAFNISSATTSTNSHPPRRVPVFYFIYTFLYSYWSFLFSCLSLRLHVPQHLQHLCHHDMFLRFVQVLLFFNYLPVFYFYFTNCNYTTCISWTHTCVFSLISWLNACL